MGKVWLNNTSGEKLFETYYGADASCSEDEADDCFDEYRLDGVINDLEIRHARIKLERLINRPSIDPVQPWKIQETEPVATPDGFSMKVSLHMDERYLSNSGWWIFQPEERIIKEVTMNMRWENGKIRLYQCEPPPYFPPVKEPEEKPAPPP